MKKLFATLVVVLLALSSTFAIDKDASTIESVSVEMASYDVIDLLMVGLGSEIALHTIHEEWALLVGASFGESSDILGDATDAWSLEAGLKYYATSFTSFALTGNFRDAGTVQNFEVVGGCFSAKHRLIAMDEVISPFFLGTAALEEVQFTGFTGIEDDFTHAVVTIGLGCDVTMRDDMGICFEAGLSQSTAISGGDNDEFYNGWFGSAAMVYYWE